jgi:hypothetical protein
MAYFANGTEGLGLEEQCETCLHGMYDGLCPVVSVQLTYNYKQLDAGNGDLRAAMNMLINEQGQCRMKAAILQAGIVFDLSGKDQLPLL